MKVLLKEDVENLGLAGEVHAVANGFGRNYLIPNGKAVIASSGVMRQAETWRTKAETRREELRAEYEALSAKIKDVKLVFITRAGSSGKLYGSITTAQIADDLNKLLGTTIDRRHVGVEPVRQLGEHKVVVRLSSDFKPEFTVSVQSEDADEAAPSDEGEMEDSVDDAVSQEEETAVIDTDDTETTDDSEADD